MYLTTYPEKRWSNYDSVSFYTVRRFFPVSLSIRFSRSRREGEDDEVKTHETVALDNLTKTDTNIKDRTMY